MMKNARGRRNGGKARWVGKVVSCASRPHHLHLLAHKLFLPRRLPHSRLVRHRSYVRSILSIPSGGGINPLFFPREEHGCCTSTPRSFPITCLSREGDKGRWLILALLVVVLLIARSKAREVLKEYDPSKPGDLSVFGHPGALDLAYRA